MGTMNWERSVLYKHNKTDFHISYTRNTQMANVVEMIQFFEYVKWRIF